MRFTEYQARTYKPPPPLRERGELKRDVLNFVIEFKQRPDQEGNSPTIRQIAEALDVSHSAIYVAALRLVKDGVLKFNANHKLITGGKYVPPKKLRKQS